MRIFHVTLLKNKHPYLQSIVNWLKKYGNKVETFDFMEMDNASSFNIIQLNLNFVEKCLKFKPDLLLVFKGDTIFKESLEIIKKKIRPIMAVWWVDDPFCKWDNAYFMTPYGNSLRSLFVWDYFFIYDTYFLTRLKKIGVNNPYYLPNATNDEFFYKIKDPQKDDIKYYGSDLSFVGTPSRLRAQMIRNLSDFNIKIWGIPWFDPFFKSLQVKINLDIDEVRKIHNYTKINLNCHLPGNVNGANVRTFDIPACGSFLLVDKCSDITNYLYKENEEVVVYNDFEDMVKKIKYYLKHDNEREQIEANAMRRTLKQHLYKHRVAELLQVIEGRQQ